MQDPRQLAFFALRSVHQGAFAEVALDKVLRSADLNDLNRGLITELVYGSVRRQRTLDALIDQLGKKKAHQQPPDLRTILHLGLYQLRYQPRIPVSAAVNTTVQLAKQNGFSGLSGFVNGLLRQYIRLASGKQQESDSSFELQLSHDPLQLPENPVERLGVLHSYPSWVIEFWLEQLGLAETEQLCEWMNQPPTIDLRVNPLQTSIEEVEAALQSAGATVSRVPQLMQALRLMDRKEARELETTVGAEFPLPEQQSKESVVNPKSKIQNPLAQSKIQNPLAQRRVAQSKIQKLPGFTEGWWTVQDASAQLVSHLLDPQAGEVIIDACAAPGGKTTHIAELIGDQGTVWACDRTSSRLKKLKENAERLKLQSIQICTGDSRHLPQFINSADRVLLDAPCSGLGTLHRRADARWRHSLENVQELSLLQGQLLDQVASWVKPGGVLVYATCTLHPLENEGVIQAFLERHSNWEIDPPAPNSPAAAFATSAGWVKVWPHRHLMDGFFMVRLQQLR